MINNKGEIVEVDEVGRVPMSKEVKEKFKLVEKDEMDVYDDGKRIYIEKYSDKNHLKGIKRRLDELKRIVIPFESRVSLNIEENDKLFIYIEGNKIVLEKCK